jgi:hypothetical protein
MRTASSGTRVGMASARAADQDREMDPELVALAKRLRRRNPKTGERTLRSIAAELARQGHLNVNGRPLQPSSARVLSPRAAPLNPS